MPSSSGRIEREKGLGVRGQGLEDERPAQSLPDLPSRNPEEPELCPHCRGAGWLRMDVKVGDPRFGKLYPCVCRTQATEERNLEELYHLSNLDAFAEKDFGNFDPEVKGVERAYKEAFDFAQQPEGWMLFLGSYGTGKTHLAAAIANYVLQVHYMQVYFAVAPDLLHHLRSTYAPSSTVTYDDRFEQIRSVHLLIVDDLGSEQSTPWAAEKLYQIFNYRYYNRLPTVVTSNADLDKLDARIRSRLCDPDLVRHVLLNANDFRMRKRDLDFPQSARPQNGQRTNGNYRRTASEG